MATPDSLGSDALSERLRVEAVSLIIRNQRVAGISFGCVGLIASLWNLLSIGTLDILVWLPAFLLGSGAVLANWRRLHARRRPDRVSDRTIHRIIGACFVWGCLWGGYAAYYLGAGGAVDDLGLSVLITGISGGSAFLLYFLPSAARAFVIPCILIPLGHALYLWSEAILPLAILGVVYMGFLEVAGMRAHAVFRGMVAQEVENERLLAEALSVNALKTRFISIMGHELKTPLNAIIGFSQLLRGAHPSGAEAEYADQVATAARHLNEMVTNVLATARIESGKHDLDEDWIQPASIVNQCIELLSLEIERKDVTVAWSPPTAILDLLCDRHAIKRILINLLSNAIKHAPPGGRIEVGCGLDEGGHLRLTVSDDGPGVKPEDARRIFDPFYQTAVQPGLANEGVGLGLYIARHLASLHGGDLTVERAGTLPGACFALTVPAERVSAQAVA